MEWRHRVVYRDDPVVVESGHPRHHRRHHFAEEDPYWADDSNGLLFPHSTGRMHRARSTGHGHRGNPQLHEHHHRHFEESPRGRPVSVVDDFSDEPSPARLAVWRDHSRPRARAASSRDPSPYMVWEAEVKNEQLRKEIEEIRRMREHDSAKAAEDQRLKEALLKKDLENLEKQRAKEAEDARIKAEEKRLREQIRLEQAEAEKKKRVEEEERKLFQERAVEEWKQKQREEEDKAKAEKEAREEEYKIRLKSDLGLSDGQISRIIKKDNENAVDLRRTTYTKIARKHISVETLRTFALPFQLDDIDPEGFVVVKRWIPEYEQESLWEHTRVLRRERKLREREAMLKNEKKKQRDKRGGRARSPGLFGFLGGRR